MKLSDKNIKYIPFERPINSTYESGSIFEKILSVKVREEKEIKMHHFPIAFALAPKSLGSRISGGALATYSRALRMMGHVTVKFRWTTPGNSYDQ